MNSALHYLHEKWWTEELENEMNRAVSVWPTFCADRADLYPISEHVAGQKEGEEGPTVSNKINLEMKIEEEWEKNESIGMKWTFQEAALQYLHNWWIEGLDS